MQHSMLIDGKLVASDRTYPSVNPATGEVLGHAPDAGVADARAAVAAARRAFDSRDWSTDVAFRARCLDQLHQALVEHREEQRALAVARRIRTGTISVNGGAWFGADVPFGGYKQSGVGREMGTAGLEEFLEIKSLAVPVPAPAPTPAPTAASTSASGTVAS
jgi:acyl-CoA reductase-like NAD-dependent aldehyde dehydrogenase